jgi:hypothetical protein
MRSIVLLLLMSCSAFGQVLDVQSCQIVSGLKNVVAIGDYVIVDKGSMPKLESVAMIKVKSEASTITVKVSDVQRSTIPTVRLDPQTYVVVGQGKLWIRVTCIDFDKKIYVDEETSILIGPPVPPEPDPVPTPVVPPDAFGNIGQRVAEWTKGLPANAELGKLYLFHAKSLKTNPATTVNEESAMLTADLLKLPAYSQYTTYSTNVNADLKARWAESPMSKGVLADYWTCIALGLGVK